jgi:hypothetical protein
MHTMPRTIAALGALALSMSPVLGVELGVFQTTDRKMDFHLATCGEADNELCVTLLDARGSAASQRVVPYIGQLVVNGAKPAGENIWDGSMRVGKYDISGRMTLRPGESFTVVGCAYFVICTDFNLIPAE